MRPKGEAVRDDGAGARGVTRGSRLPSPPLKHPNLSARLSRASDLEANHFSFIHQLSFCNESGSPLIGLQHHKSILDFGYFLRRGL
jgi:hypothetical protein